VRLDSTVTAALMHEPSDSTLLSDALRVMTRLLQRGEVLPGAPAVQWRDRRRLAKKRARAIEYSRGQDKKRQLYRELIAATEASRVELQAMAASLAEAAEIGSERWRAEVAAASGKRYNVARQRFRGSIGRIEGRDPDVTGTTVVYAHGVGRARR